jgi:hypothetical protein
MSSTLTHGLAVVSNTIAARSSDWPPWACVMGLCEWWHLCAPYDDENASCKSWTELHRGLEICRVTIWSKSYRQTLSYGTRFTQKVKLPLCLTNYALRHEGVWGSGCIDQRVLYLGPSWRWVVSFTPRPLYPRGKSPLYPLDRRLGGPHGEVKILAPTGTRTPTLGRPASRQSLYRLRYPGSTCFTFLP